MLNNFTANYKLEFFLLILITLAGILVRTYKLSTLPLPPNGDELAYGYYGWSLLKFGTDEYQNSYPIYFPSIGDYKYPTLAYLNILPASVFGLSEITVRFWPVVSGAILIIAMFLLSNLFFSSHKPALFSAFFLAFSPWEIILSRVAYGTIIGICSSSYAIFSLIYISKLKGKGNKINIQKNKLFILSLILFLISSFSYGSLKIFIPAFLFGLLIIIILTKPTLLSIKKHTFILFIILTIISVASLSSWQSRGRASGVIWRGPSQDAIDKNIYYDGISEIKTSLLVTRVFHNKITSGILETSIRYFSHFSPDFLFFKGDRSPETVPDLGVTMQIEIILSVIGILTLWKLRNNNLNIIPYIWLLTGPLAASITKDGPHLVRASIMFPAIAIFSGYGLYQVTEILKKISYGKILLLFFVLLITVNASFVIHQIFVHKPVTEPWGSDQGKKELVYEVLARKDKYKAVAMKEDPYIFFLFYGKITPQEFLNDSEIIPEAKETQWERVKRFSNIYFGMPFDCPKGGKLNVLYICKGSEVPQNSKVLKIIRFKDNIPAYTLIEFLPFSKTLEKQEELPSMLKYMVEKETLYPDGIIPDSHPSFW